MPRTIQAAVKAKCLDCCGGSRVLVGQCFLRECPLWPFRGVETTTEDPEEVAGEVVVVAKVEATAEKGKLPETNAALTTTVIKHHIEEKPARKPRARMLTAKPKAPYDPHGKRLRGGRRSAEEVQAEKLIGSDVFAALTELLSK